MCEASYFASVSTVESGDYRPTPPVGGSSDLRGIVGVTTHDERMIFVLDVGRFIELALALAASGALLEAP